MSAQFGDAPGPGFAPDSEMVAVTRSDLTVLACAPSVLLPK